VPAEPIGDRTIRGFLDALSSDSPTPGGGAVAALCGAAGAALVAMVCRLTVGRDAYEEVEDRMREVQDRAEAACAAFLELADRDAEAFDAVMAAFGLPKEDDRARAERSAAIQRAYEGAARVPLDVADLAVDLMGPAVEVTEDGNANAASDGVSAAHALYAAAQAALANVAINAAGLRDGDVAGELTASAASLRERAASLLDAADAAFAARIS
jgi:formiminotetrahydrofolate cyclodeaminase